MKVLAISPKLPQPSNLEAFSHCLDFLKPQCAITFVDSLEKFENLSFNAFSDYWQQKILSLMDQYDAFIGFSLGGVVLLNCLQEFNSKNKVIILCSTPSKLEPVLSEKLSAIYNLTKDNQTQEAIHQLNNWIFSKEKEGEDALLDDKEIVNKRMQFGLGYVLHHPLPERVLQSTTKVYQLVGENSKLVTKDNIYVTPNTTLCVVPHSGQRVLEDNPEFTQKMIKDWLYVK